MVWHDDIKFSKKCVGLRERKVAGAEKYNKFSDWSWKILVWLFFSKYVSESLSLLNLSQLLNVWKDNFGGILCL